MALAEKGERVITDKAAKKLVKEAATMAVKEVLDLIDMALKQSADRERRVAELVESVGGLFDTHKQIVAQLNRVTQNAIVEGISRGVEKAMSPKITVPGNGLG